MIERKHMVNNNLYLRIISALILGFISIFCIIKGSIFFQILMIICMSIMTYEWYNINKNKKTLLFILGFFYILIPMIFWMFNYNIIDILWIFTIVWSCDIFAYFGGKLLKGPKFAPKISPNKTWSGVISGSIFSFIFSIIYMYNFIKIDIVLIILSIFLIISSILGDLLESKIKRTLNVKDTGNIIPGHGGLCDRLDSFLLVSFIFILYKFILT